jgi:protein tyrosine phosphatase (PTP) superfamily phosphohydrolase (DUF442 family)
MPSPVTILRSASARWAWLARQRRVIALSLMFVLAPTSLLAKNALTAQVRQRVEGVTNFGKVTEHFFRGGELTIRGIENLAALGVRKIIDLRDDAEPEIAETCKRLGITYLNLPMSQHETPDKATIDSVLQHLNDTRTKTYVHCSGGKHRAGTIGALYRMKVQGWAPERAWNEQQSYGFGPPEEHPDLFLFAYGRTPVAKKLRKDPVDEDSKGDWIGPAPESTSPTAPPATEAKATTVAKKTDAAGDALSATVRYVAPADAVKRARASGATGNLARINLEYDRKRAVAVWKVIFASTMEYRFDAVTGALLATKAKEAEALAVLSPLTLSNRLLSFQNIISKAERLTGDRAAEMELKRVKGRNRVFFEVAMHDGRTLFFDAMSGKQILAF